MQSDTSRFKSNNNIAENKLHTEEIFQKKPAESNSSELITVLTQDQTIQRAKCISGQQVA